MIAEGRPLAVSPVDDQRPADMSAADIVITDNSRGMVTARRLLGGDPPKAAAALLLAENRPIMICTGFPVHGHPETDGPPGALALADGLQRLGKQVHVASWKAVIDGCLKVRSRLTYCEVSTGRSDASLSFAGCAVVTVEVCGQIKDGTYRNMNGQDISDATPWFEQVVGLNALVSVGDGGNEFGMGSVPHAFFSRSAIQQPISTADCVVPASVSNYGCYAILKELGDARSLNLLPEPDEHLGMIHAMVDAGFVDGISGDAVAKVDGRGVDDTLQIIAQLRASAGSSNSPRHR